MRQERCTQVFGGKKTEGKYHLEDLGVDGGTILVGEVRFRNRTSNEGPGSD